MWSFKKSPRPEELSTLTKTASFRCVLKPMASRSARVLGRSLGGHVYVISPPSRPNMYVVPAGEEKKEETAQKEKVSSPLWSDTKRRLSTAEHYYHSKSSISAAGGEHRRPAVFHCAE